MALIKCPECGKEISEYAELCLGCGCPMRIIQRDFKRLGMILLLSKIFGGSDFTTFDNATSIIGKSNISVPATEYIELFDNILVTLTPREVEIIKYRFGFNDGCVHSYEELSMKYKVSEERICQIESKALGKLQHPSRYERLEVMWEYPSLELLKDEAINRGYIVWTDTERLPKAWSQSGFGRCCFELLRMCDPSLYSGELLSFPIDNLGLSVRSYNCLKRANINDVTDLTRLSFSELQQIRNLSSDSCQEIVEKLSSLGLELCEDE